MQGRKIGHLVSKETRNKISNSLKGHIPWNRGLPGLKGELNSNWKGDKVGYSGIHMWVRQQLGTPSKCETCKTTRPTRYHWANKSQKYLRDLTDYIRLCPSCHRKYDNKMLKRVIWNKGLKANN
jgi:hypothetical protein